MNEQLAFWKNQLRGPLLALEFKKDGVQKSELTFQMARVAIELDETLFRDIKAFARKENCTPVYGSGLTVNILLLFPDWATRYPDWNDSGQPRR